MDRAKIFAGGLGEAIVNFLRWVIHFGRKHPIAAAGYLVFYAWFFFHSTRQPDFPPPLPPVPQSSASPNASPVTVEPLAPPPPPAPVVPLAQAQAFRNGNNVVIQWNQPVTTPQLYADGTLLTAECRPQACTAPVTGKIYQLRAEWQENGQRVKKLFRF